MKDSQKAFARDLAFASVMALLFAGTFAFAQGTMEKIPDGDANQSSPGLHNFNSDPSAQAGEIEVLNGPVSFHTRNYLGFGVLANIRGNWRRALHEKGLIPASGQKAFAIEFTVLKDGVLDSRKLVKSSGDSELDATGLEAITKSAPFMAIPGEFNGEYLKLRCHFYLNPGRRIPPVSRAWGAETIDIAGNTPAGAEGTIHGNGGPTQPRAVYSPAAEYSDQARKAKVEGTAVLRVTVSEGGEVTDAKVVKGLGSGLDEKAIEAVRRWQFKPATKDGTPVKSDITVEVSFHLFK